MKGLKMCTLQLKLPRRSAVGRQVKSIAVPYTYIGNTIYRRGTATDRGGSMLGPRMTGERNCRGLRTILLGVERACGKNLDCTVCCPPYISSMVWVIRDQTWRQIRNPQQKA